MLDKNGIQIKTGYVVKISGAYFKNDNGYFFVRYSPGDPSWTGGYISLKKISKNGKISQARYSLNSWPISCFVSDPHKRALANEWNAEHAKIEVVNDVDRSDIMAFFKEREEEAAFVMEDERRKFESSDTIRGLEEIRRFYADLVSDIRLELALENLEI